MNIAPEPLPIRSNAQPTMLKPHITELDHRGRRQCLPSPGQPSLKHLDLSDCRLDDSAVEPLVQAAAERPNGDGLSTANLSENRLGKKSAASFTCSAPHRRISGHSCLSIAGSMIPLPQSYTPPLWIKPDCRDVVPCAHNALGASVKLAEMLSRNQHITDLNLSWNNIREQVRRYPRLDWRSPMCEG